ncbi:MAG TPA: prepilin-type N-terminal cleavage/methylation domain-containing protein [Planctomycetota bacterium]|nr:prepilin-type N-terminal cleavage/methylation domain-containing protein [Planctomycetota bacterium]
MNCARRGFSLFEVVIALAVFALGVVAVLTLYNNNVRSARQTKEEIALALVRREIQTRMQLAALSAIDAQGDSTFAGSDWLLRDISVPDDPGDPEPLDGPNPNPPAPDSIALNLQNWNAVKARFDALGSPWDENAAFAGFQFRMRTVWPAEVESHQFMDIDGYDVWDGTTGKLSANIYSDDVQGLDTALPAKMPLDPPAAARATRPPTAKNDGYFGPPRPSHGAVYDPRGMKHYLKRIKCVIGWDMAKSSDIFSGQKDIFYFTIYNPDARKDPR